MQTESTTTAVAAAEGVATTRVAVAAFAALFGAVLLWAVGFSHLEAAHNAAHDTRHSNAFPCH